MFAFSPGDLSKGKYKESSFYILAAHIGPKARKFFMKNEG
jgi:hypothetical protein